MKKLVMIAALALLLALSVCAQDNSAKTSEQGGTMIITIKGSQPGSETSSKTFTAALVKNSSTAALRTLLKVGPVTLHMHDYGNFEKVGDLGKSLPANDERITTEPGDLILYQGNLFVLYYAPNT
ncbi:MAG: cyclophilin-like fold protein [Treponematales bacterium]